MRLENQVSFPIMASNDLTDYLKESKHALIRSLRREGILKSSAVEDALLSIPRENFLSRDCSAALAYQDEPLPLGDSGQTISAPHMVVIMLEELDLKPGLRVLEIGTGSGYNAALMGHIVSKGLPLNAEMPMVISIERDEKLAQFATENIRRIGLSKAVRVVVGDGSLGYPQESEEELYDRIIVTAGAPRIPSYLKKQLKKGGILEAPVGGRTFQQLLKLTKREGRSGKAEYEETRLVECAFVPLIGLDAHQP